MDKLDMILDKLDEVKGEVTELKGEVTELKGKAGNIEFVLENEIRTNIARVAEGHLDLSRNLQVAVKSNNEFEILTVRMAMLESDVRMLKQKIS